MNYGDRIFVLFFAFLVQAVLVGAGVGLYLGDFAEPPILAMGMAGCFGALPAFALAVALAEKGMCTALIVGSGVSIVAFVIAVITIDPVVTAIAVAFGALVVGVLVPSQSKRRVKSGRCSACQYDLVGLASHHTVCPECGADFSTHQADQS